MKDYRNVEKWLAENEEKVDPKSFIRAKDYFERVLKPALINQPGMRLFPVLYYPYQRTTPDVSFRVELGDQATDAGYIAEVQFDDPLTALDHTRSDHGD